MDYRKDAILDGLADDANVAQFVSFAPDLGAGGLRQQYCRVVGYAPNHRFASPQEALESLLAAAPDRSINLRSFLLGDPRSHAFHYGLKNVADALEKAHRLGVDGFYVIANETVDVADGGVSGVVQGDVIEFAPDDTPRCVEKPGAASLPLAFGLELLAKVYGFAPDFGDTTGWRIEFSIHPLPRGWRNQHVLLWEKERVPMGGTRTVPHWPNRFSRHVGDKVFGLLVADTLNAPVPRSLVLSRRVAPFSFGRETGDLETWLRTAPTEQQPGLFTTVKGWVDPFALMQREDPDGEAIASILSQQAVRAVHSGAALEAATGELVVEGASGAGDALMLGERLPEPLPDALHARVQALHACLSANLGPIRFEWVDDGEQTWVVQLHAGRSISSPLEIVPGEAQSWHSFEVRDGLPALRRFLATLGPGDGVILQGRVGLTSHIADLLRKTGRPARMATTAP